MKTTFLFICLSVFLSSFQEKHKKIRSTQNFAYQYRDGKFEETGYQLSEVLYDKNGNVTERFNRPLYGNAIYHQYFTYDSIGNLVLETQNNKYKTAYKYDNNRRMIEMRELDYYSNSLKTVEYYTYDALGNELETIKKDNKGEQLGKKIYKYKNNQLELITEYRRDTIWQVTKIETNEKSKTEIQYDSKGMIVARSVRIYDKNKNEIESSDCFLKTRSDSICHTSIMIYNKQGKCTEKTEKENGKLFLKHLNKYNNDGTLIEIIYYRDMGDVPSSMHKIVNTYYE